MDTTPDRDPTSGYDPRERESSGQPDETTQENTAPGSPAENGAGQSHYPPPAPGGEPYQQPQAYPYGYGNGGPPPAPPGGYPQDYPGWAPPAAPQRPRRRLLTPVLIVITLLALIVAFVAGCAVGTRQGTTGTNAAIGGSTTVSVPPSAQAFQQTVITVIQTVQPSVVEVNSQGSQGQSIGSGEIISADGYIVTNDHVVAGFSQYSVNLSSGQTLSARLIGEAPGDDLAVLKVNANNLRPIAFADSSKVVVGQFAIALGSPLGLQQSATFGIVSALNRSASEAPNGPAQTLVGLVQTSAPINPGNSGGALVDLEGKLIGIPTLGAVNPESNSAASGIGFAIPSSRVQFVAKQLIENGKLVTTGQGFLGVRGTDVTPQLANAYNLPVQSGFLVTGFANDTKGVSPAEQAGIQNGDIIVKINDQEITGNGDLSAFLLNQEPGTKIDVTVQRGNSQKTISVTLGERPPNAG